MIDQTGMRHHGPLARQPAGGSAQAGPGDLFHGWPGILMIGAMALAVPVFAQQKTGPSPMGEDALTFHGVTLYGVIDIGLQFETHGAAFSDYRPAATGDIVQKNSRQSEVGFTPSNMGQSRIGLQGIEPLGGEWSAVFQIESFFNPQSANLADSLKSLAANNGQTTATSGTSQDGSSAGQNFQTAFMGVRSTSFGALTFGRQLTLLAEGTVKYDPNHDATAFGLLGASGTYSGGGSSEDKRLDSMLKYAVSFIEGVHFAAIFRPSEALGADNKVFQFNVGADLGRVSVDAYYSTVYDAISATSLSPSQVAGLPKLGFVALNSLSATISDNSAYSLMGDYRFDSGNLLAGYEHINISNPRKPLSAGFTDVGGYNLAYVNDTAYGANKDLNVYWIGVRYDVTPKLNVTAAYYVSYQNAYGTGKQSGCNSSKYSVCSGNTQALSVDTDYRFSKHLDVYLGIMYSGVHDGAANGYTFDTTNLDPTIGVRYKF